MSMVENMENEEFNGTTIEVEEDSEEQSGSETVELDDEQVSGAEAYIGNAVDVTDEVNQTRTKVRKKSEGDDELENYSEGVQKRINQLTAKRKAASEEAEAAESSFAATRSGIQSRI